MNEKELAELFADLWSWGIRWQEGRRLNSQAHVDGKADYAKIILDAASMNRELDNILAELAAKFPSP